MKKLVGLALALIMAIGLSAPVWANEDAESNRFIGTIVDFSDTHVEVQDETEEAATRRFALTGQTVRIDAATGQAASAAHQGERVLVYFNIHDEAEVAAFNLPEHRFSPHLAVVEAADHEEDCVKVTILDGSVMVTIERDSPLMPYLTRNNVTIDMIQVGSKLLLWYEIMAMSHPAQATSERAVLLNYVETPNTENGHEEAYENDDENGPITATETDEYESEAPYESSYETGYEEEYPNGHETSGNGTPQQPTHEEPPAFAMHDIDGVAMGPVRETAERLGFTVSWDADTSSAQLYKNGIHITLSPGKNAAHMDNETIDLHHAPVIVDGRMMAPAAFFDLL